MSDYDLLRLFKLLHVLAVILLGSGVVIEGIVGPMMPRAKSVSELRVLARISKLTELFIFIPAFLLIPAFGYATGSKENIDYSMTWISIAQGLFYIAVLMTLAIELPASFRLNKALAAAPEGPLTPELTRQVNNKLPAVVGMLLSLFFVFIVYLMVVKPGW